MEAKSEAVTILLLNLALFLPCLSTAASSDQSFNPSVSKGPIHHDYTRFADVERHCQSVLSSATELRYDPDRAGELKYKLSFVNGDWSQDAGQAPLLPFHGSSAAAAAAAAGHELLEAVPLASLMLLDIDTMPRQGARNAVNVSGVLSFTITRNYPELELWPGFARLIVQLQGVYTETKSSASGGERVLCMVGDAVLPVRGSNGTDSWNFAKNHAGDGWVKPPVVADGNILLVLRYPMPATLTNRAVRGEMTSTSAASDAAYFDTIRLVSQLAGGGYDSGYQFQPEDALLDAAGAVAGCGGGGDDDDDPPLSHDSRASLCDIVYQQSNPGSKVIMELIPNWDCKGTDAFCSRFGPFENTRAGASATSARKEKGMAFTRSAIAVQSIQCKRTGSVGGGGTAARVAVVLRYVPPWEHQPTAATRTGLGGATVSAEGVWNASTRRACMVGCLGAGDEKSCRYRVTLSVQRTLSMARRGGIVGQITSMDGSHAPLLFQQRVNPRFISSGASRTPRMSYVYTKVDQALELRRRSGKPTRFVAKSLLSYPIVAGNDAGDMASLSNLAENLNLRFQCVARPPFVPEWVEECCYELQILSIGSLVGSYSAPLHGRRSSKWIEALRRARAVANRQVLNVSAEFTASRNSFLSPIPVMSAEGVYDPKDGRMHLIGCRSVHAPWPELAKRGDLEDGIMDCDIEVTVDYPPTTTRWLPIGRTAKVSVSSTREEGDPLHFARTELHSVPVAYRDRQLHELVRPILEGILCITVLSVARIIFVPVAFFQLLG